MEQIEMSAIDLRLEYTRTRDRQREARLLVSIMQQDIREPLLVSRGADSDAYILHDGFKRYRCAKKLQRGIVGVERIADDEVSGCIRLLQRQQSKQLTIMEEAALVEYLYNKHDMSIYEIGQRLEHSASWVSMRLGIMQQMSECVRSKIMSGQFPARAYLYGIKKFTRVNSVSKHRVDGFVEAVSGKGLSTRQMTRLAQAFLSGGELIERLVMEGDVHRALSILGSQQGQTSAYKQQEPHSLFVKELKTILLQMQSICTKADAMVPCPGVWMEQINRWSGAVVGDIQRFCQTMEQLYDRSRAPIGGINAVSAGGGSGSNSPAVAHEYKDSAQDPAQGQCEPEARA